MLSAYATANAFLVVLWFCLLTVLSLVQCASKKKKETYEQGRPLPVPDASAPGLPPMQTPSAAIDPSVAVTMKSKFPATHATQDTEMKSAAVKQDEKKKETGEKQEERKTEATQQTSQVTTSKTTQSDTSQTSQD